MLFACVKNRHNVLVLQAASRFGLAEEAFAGIGELFAFKLIGQRHGFDGYHAANFRVFAQIHHAHSTLAQLFFNLVAAQHGLFYAAPVEQHSATRVRATAAQNHGF